jgi:hypothetical protein
VKFRSSINSFLSFVAIIGFAVIGNFIITVGFVIIACFVTVAAAELVAFELFAALSTRPFLLRECLSACFGRIREFR